MTNIAFSVSLTEGDWDSAIRGWRCPALRVPGVIVDALYAAGRVNPDDYNIDVQQQVVSWRKEGSPPREATISMHLSQELTSEDVTARWKTAAIWLPPVVAIVVALIPLVWGKLMGPGSDMYDLYHIHGRVIVDSNASAKAIEGITIALRPPHLQPMSDGTFDDEIPVRVLRGVPVFPDLLFSPLPGVREPVVHLDRKWLGFNAPNYGVAINDHNIDIVNPIEYVATPNQPYNSTATPLTTPAPVVTSPSPGTSP